MKSSRDEQPIRRSVHRTVPSLLRSSPFKTFIKNSEL